MRPRHQSTIRLTVLWTPVLMNSWSSLRGRPSNVRVVRGGDPVLGQRPFHVIRRNSEELRITYGVLFGEQERQELKPEEITFRLLLPVCSPFIPYLIQLQHGLSLLPAPHVSHQELSDTAQVRCPGFLGGRGHGQRSAELFYSPAVDVHPTFWSICKNFWKS